MNGSARQFWACQSWMDRFARDEHLGLQPAAAWPGRCTAIPCVVNGPRSFGGRDRGRPGRPEQTDPALAVPATGRGVARIVRDAPTGRRAQRWRCRSGRAEPGHAGHERALLGRRNAVVDRRPAGCPDRDPASPTNLPAGLAGVHGQIGVPPMCHGADLSRGFHGRIQAADAGTELATTVGCDLARAAVEARGARAAARARRGGCVAVVRLARDRAAVPASGRPSTRGRGCLRAGQIGPASTPRAAAGRRCPAPPWARPASPRHREPSRRRHDPLPRQDRRGALLRAAERLRTEKRRGSDV